MADAQDEKTPVERPTGPIYTPADGELQLTVRAVGIGALLGAVIIVINVYFGLKTGWTIGGSLIAAILSFSVFSMLRPKRPFTVLETNIAQTTASAAGSMVAAAGLIAPLPAIGLLGQPLSGVQMMLWAGSVAWIGVFFAIPLRRQMILVDRLRFPTGTATAHTIVAMFGSGVETMRKARALLVWALIAGAVVVLQFFVPDALQPPITEWIPGAVLTTLGAFTFTLYLDPMLMGAGILVGMRTSVSLVAGALVAWGILAPLAEAQGWVTGSTMSYESGSRGWILWTGVAIMIADALTNLALSWRSILATFRRPKPGESGELEDESKAIPRAWWLGGLAIASVFTVVAVWAIFDIPAHLTLIAIALSSVLAAIATRAAGETDINPISGVGKVTQLVFAGLAPGQAIPNVLTAGITAAGATQTSDMMQDLKTGYLLGAWPKKQFVAQLVGIAAGVVLCVPIFLLITHGKELGSAEFPAPSVFAWKATAEVLSEGIDTLPANAGWGALGGLLFGMFVPLLRKFVPRTAPFLPSALAFGIAFIIPAFFSIPFLIGAVGHAIWKKASPGGAAALGFAVASGIMVGAGLAGIVTSILDAFGVNTIAEMMKGL